MLCGLGIGFEGAILGILAKSQKPERKSRMITLLLATKQIGIILGPGNSFYI